MRRHLLHILFFVAVCLYAGEGFAQSDEDAKAFIRQKIEEVSERYELNLDYTDILDVLYYYYQNPLNINSASADELRSLGLFSEVQINNLLRFRKKNGNFETIYELKDIEGFDYVFINYIKIFLKVSPLETGSAFNWRNAFKYGRSDVILRYGRVLQQQKGYVRLSDSVRAVNPNAGYLGSPAKLYMRYRFTYRDKLSIGVTCDKDAGEEFFRGSNPYGFDFYSAHFFFRNTGRLKALALGDYHLEFGQGLTLWSGLGFGKSVDVLGVQKIAGGLKPSSSANENLYFRGAAATVSISDPVNVTLFYSGKGLDAGLRVDTLNAEELYFQSIQETGMHRTPAEIEKKHAINEQVFGGNVSFDNYGFHAGVTAYKTMYDKKLQKTPYPYQIYDFQGDENINAGVDMSWSLSSAGFFGEFSISANGGKAFVGGMVADLHPRYKMSLVYRYFAPDYQVIYAVPFAEGSAAANEKGFFLGALAFVGRSGSISAYYDIFSFPWLRYRVNSPSLGNEFLVQYSNEVSRHFKFYFRLKSETKTLNYNDASQLVVSPEPLLRRSLRANLRYDISHEVVFQTRVETMQYRHQPSAVKYGYLLFQDINYRPSGRPFDISFRYAIFSTDDYDTRIYAYENDVLYKFSIPAYYYKGQRFYVMFHFDILTDLDLWLRFSNTAMTDRNTFGSNLEEIEGNVRSDITAQIRWKF